MHERIMIAILAALLALSTHIYMGRIKPKHWMRLSVSTFLLTGILLLHYQRNIYDASHGIGILLLPLVTIWLVWRKENTGKPAISVNLFIALQVLYCLLYATVVWLQES